MKSPRIVFMGTPEFAVATLGSLLMNGYNVVSVVTAPDKPAGRGRKMTPPPVKEFALQSCLPVMQPPNLKDPSFISELESLKADLYVVVAFRMLPEAVWKIPPMGTMNLHASLLPHYRGAAPINHAIINGEKTTGVTTFFINDKIDTGDLLLREEVKIFANESAGDLQKRLMKLGARLVIKTIRKIAAGTINPAPQSLYLRNGELPREAPKLTPEFCIINWEKDCIEVHNFIRGLSPAPCARTFISGDGRVLMMKIFESQPQRASHSARPGEIITDSKTQLRIACSNGFINVLSLQLEGKKRMTPAELMRGFRISGMLITEPGQEALSS